MKLIAGILIGFVVSSSFHWNAGWNAHRRQAQGELREYLAHPESDGVWLDTARFEVVNKKRSYYKVEAK